MDEEWTKQGGAAFPVGNDDGHDPEPGMSLRDWFAGQALSGWMASYSVRQTPQQVNVRHPAQLAYDLADAMLRARKGD